MSDRNPIVLRRMLALRQFSLFAGVEFDELATLADNLVETSHPAGAVIAAAGARLPALHFVLDGRIGSSAMTWGPREAQGVLEALADREPALSVTAEVATTTLQLASDEFADVLEDNFGVLVSVLRNLAGHVIPTKMTLTRPALALMTEGRLGLVERLMVLRRQVPFARVQLHALATLAQASEELIVPAGTILTRLGDPADRAIVIIEGTVRAQHPEQPAVVHRAGDAIGMFETFAGVCYGETVEALTPVRALASSGVALFDVIEDHTDVGIAMLATFASALLDARGGEQVSDPIANAN